MTIRVSRPERHVTLVFIYEKYRTNGGKGTVLFQLQGSNHFSKDTVDMKPRR